MVSQESRFAPGSFHIGWDVGGWNCDKNSQSRDAVAIVDGGAELVGCPWRGNLRESINAASSARDWIAALFDLCGCVVPESLQTVVLAIDTPLALPREFLALAHRLEAVDRIDESQGNPYLYRHTERVLFRRGWKPLSPVKDMIGSQATKGRHVLAKFAPHIESCGVWSDGLLLRAIEAYPTPARRARSIQQLRQPLGPAGHPDCEDALTCALVAWLFANRRKALLNPDSGAPLEEGWIWIPA